MGITSFQFPEELTAKGAPLFMAWQDAECWWGGKQARDRWSMVSHGAGLEDEQYLADLADRIACAVDECETHLQSLCKAYATQLGAQEADDWALSWRCFSDGHSQAVYPIIHGLFWQMAVLRDLLAEFAARYVFHRPAITSFAGLLKHLERDQVRDPVFAAQLLAAGSPGGWIAVFSSYRNLFTHVASLQSVEGTHRTFQDTRYLYGRAVPQLYYALPHDPEQLVRLRSTGTVGRVAKADRKSDHPLRDREPDALEYLAGTFNEFVTLAIGLALRSPIEPRMPVLDDDDIIEFRAS
jgi:hypothetical protein